MRQVAYYLWPTVAGDDLDWRMEADAAEAAAKEAHEHAAEAMASAESATKVAVSAARSATEAEKTLKAAIAEAKVLPTSYFPLTSYF